MDTSAHVHSINLIEAYAVQSVWPSTEDKEGENNDTPCTRGLRNYQGRQGTHWSTALSTSLGEGQGRTEEAERAGAMDALGSERMLLRGKIWAFKDGRMWLSRDSRVPTMMEWKVQRARWEEEHILEKENFILIGIFLFNL